MALRDATQRWASGWGRSARVSTLPSGASTRRTGAGEVISIIGAPRNTNMLAKGGAGQLRAIARRLACFPTPAKLPRTFPMEMSEYDETRATTRLPNVDIEIFHRRPWEGNEGPAGRSRWGRPGCPQLSAVHARCS